VPDSTRGGIARAPMGQVAAKRSATVRPRNRSCFRSSRLLMARIGPHKLACQLLSLADQPLGLLAQLVLFRVGAMLLTAFAHCLLSGSGSLIETTPCRRGSNPQRAGQISSSGTKLPFATSVLRLSSCLIRDAEPAFGQEFLHVAIAERKPQVQPDGHRHVWMAPVWQCDC